MISFLLLDSSYPINTRNKRIVKTLNVYYGNESVNYIAWNRDGRNILDTDNPKMIYCQKSAYGNWLSKFIHLLGYYQFIKKWNLLNKPKVLIASHWDMLFLACILKRKNQFLIYENLDIPTASNTILRKLFECIEKIALKKTSAIIFASRFFEPLYSTYSGKKYVLENKPLQTFERCSFGEKRTDTLVIAYIGLIRYAEILKNLIDVIKKLGNVTLYFHGEGQDLDELKKYADNNPNILFTGRYEVEDLPRLYASADLVWAAYPNKDYNVKYAISNKFHESIIFHVPCIYAEKTLLGYYVEKENLGYIVNPYDVSAIKALIDYVMKYREDILDKKHSLELYENQENGWNVQFQPIIDYLNTLK